MGHPPGGLLQRIPVMRVFIIAEVSVHIIPQGAEKIATLDVRER